MGCTPSKRSVCQNCNAQCSPVRRSYSLFPHHSSPRDDNNRCVVALTSTMLHPTTECMERAVASQVPEEQEHVLLNVPHKDKGFALGVVEAKAWSKLIGEKINKTVPKTPIRTPPGEPETINVWELMEGLDDSSPFHSPSMVDHNAKKPLQIEKKEAKLILYYTSLRGVRKTYEDCCNVRVILKNYGVRVDERDVSMHSGFKDELKELLGDRHCGGTLPKVFVGRKYIGGAEEIRRFHDEFQLDKVFEGCETMVHRGGGSDDGGCEACGDVRFLLCQTCSGSCKIYQEVSSDRTNDDEVKEEKSDNFGFQRCLDCNENGLVRCPICCD